MPAASRFPVRFLTQAACFAWLCLLAACADTPLPKWFSNEPTKEEMLQPRGAVIMPALGGEGDEYPNLGDIPQKPKVTSPQAVQTIMNDLREENTKGLAAIETYQQDMKAVPIKPKPEIKKTKKKWNKQK